MQSEAQPSRSFIPAYVLKTCKECGSRSELVPGASLLPGEAISTYYTPSDTDHPVIKQIVSDSELAAQTLQAEIRKIESRLLALRRSYEIHRSALSPIRKLPDDLLRQIFIKVICPEGIDISSQYGEIWAFSGVCVRWEAVVRGTPFLWSKLTITALRHRDGPDERTLGWRYSTCLKLSKAVPLSISLFPSRNQQQIRAQVGTLERILNYENRLEWLSINTNIAQEISSESTTAVRCNQLHRLTILGGTSTAFPFELLRNAEQLEDVDMNYVALTGATIAHWGNLKRLTLSRIEGSLLELIAMMKDCPLLEALKLGGANFAPAGTEHASNKMIMLPALRSLTLCRIKKDIIYGLCPLLNVPNLANLEVENDAPLNWQQVDVLSDMIERSRCSINRLHLNTYSWMRHIYMLPHIRELRLTGSQDRQGEFVEVLSRLVWNSEPTMSVSKNILPNLRTLELQVLFTSNADSYTVIHNKFIPDIMRSRSRQIESSNTAALDSHPLTSIKYISTHSDNIADVDKITELGKNLGMTVESFYIRRGTAELEWC